ncbi:MAG: hypothetical protein AB1772_11580 [Candidatus Zixiibacteriota bacterium]
MPKRKSKLEKVRITSGLTSCKVSPGFVIAVPGDRIKFCNRTSGVVYVHVSDDKLFDEPRFKIAAGRDRTQKVKGVERGIYPYAVFCAANRAFGTGSSMPIIIVPR